MLELGVGYSKCFDNAEKSSQYLGVEAAQCWGL